MLNARQLTIAILIYQNDYDVWPDSLGVLEPEYVDPELQITINPREGFAGYAYEVPENHIDEIEDPSTFAFVFEVRDDGKVMGDSGVIGFADGHAVFVPEEE